MIVGFSAPAGTGKSTAASFLEAEYGFVRHNMKDALIKEMRVNFKETLEELSFIYDRSVDDLFKTKPPAMRALMINYGIEVRRSDNPNYWVYEWIATLPEGNVVVDDIRFIEEYEAVKRLGGIVIRLVRDDIKDTSGHISETEQDLIVPDYTIECVRGEFDILHSELKAIIDAET